MQQGLGALQTERVGGVGGIGLGKGEAVVGRHTGGVDVVKAILVGIDGKGETIGRCEDVAAETERAVGKAELRQQGGGKVGLVHQEVDGAWLLHCSPYPEDGYARGQMLAVGL